MFFYGVSMSPGQWIITLMLALLVFITPMLMIEAFAENFPEPLRTITIVIMNYIGIPLIACLLYKWKIHTRGQGSIIFWVYFGLYTLFAISMLLSLFFHAFKWDNMIAAIVGGVVATFMYSFASKQKQKLNKRMQEEQEAERSDAIERHAQAIVLAEKLKRETVQE